MLTIDDVIERFDGSLAYSTNSKEICQYIADLLKELKERREYELMQGCYGCKHNPFKEKHRCRSCKRMCLDKYEPERRADGKKTGN